MDYSEADEQQLRIFLEAGSDIAGNAAGAALGAALSGLTGGFAGALAGPLVTHIIRSQAVDFAARVLSAREKKKIAGVLDVTAAHIQQKLKLGYEPRHDDFFVGSPGDRSFAEEIAEGVLIAAQREYEERKLPYMGYLLANIAFHPEIDRFAANLLVRQAESLSYRQLILLVTLAHKERFGIGPGLLGLDGKIRFDALVYLQEIYDLYRRGLAFVEGGGYMLDVATLSPGSLVIHGPGNVLTRLMELERIPLSELQEVADAIRVQNEASSKIVD